MAKILKIIHTPRNPQLEQYLKNWHNVPRHSSDCGGYYSARQPKIELIGHSEKNDNLCSGWGRERV